MKGIYQKAAGSILSVVMCILLSGCTIGGYDFWALYTDEENNSDSDSNSIVGTSLKRGWTSSNNSIGNCETGLYSCSRQGKSRLSLES